MAIQKSIQLLISFFAVAVLGGFLFFGDVTTDHDETGAARNLGGRSTTSVVPTVYECDYSASTVPFNQGLLDYTIRSDRSKQDSENKVDMSRRFSMVDKNLASQYLILEDFGDKQLNQVVFSMLEYYACMLPKWLYEKLEGVYLAKYFDSVSDDSPVTRSSVMVLNTREDAVYVAQLLMSLSTDELEFKWVNGNYVAYTAQKAYWWIHDNQIIRIASHDVQGPDATDAQRNAQLESFAMCETLDVVDSMIQAECIKDSFWDEVPTDILYGYLAKLPSDGDEIDWENNDVHASQIAGEIEWPSENEQGEYQWGCDPERNAEINKAFASMEDAFSGDKDVQRAKMLSREDDKVKISVASTDKRWYYLGETVHFFGSAVSLDGNMGNVFVDVNENIFPHPEIDTIVMAESDCGERESYQEQVTGIEKPEVPDVPTQPTGRRSRR